MTEPKISVYENRYGTSPIKTTTVEDYLHNIKSGLWQDYVLAVRSGKAQKDQAQGVTVSAFFKANRKSSEAVSHSGFLAIDIDYDDNPDIKSKREALQDDPHCYACHHSIRGFGLVWYVKIEGTKHKDAFLAIEKYLANKYEIVVDPSGKDISRFRFISYDPDLFLNRKSKTWRKYLAKKDKPEIKPTYNAYHQDDMGHIMRQIQDKAINIAEDYDSWLKIGFALSSEFGEAGRAYYHTISSQSAKYDSKACDKQYDTSLKRSESGVTIGTFFHYCSKAGIDIKTQLTKDIISVGKQRMRSNRNRKEAKESTKEYFLTMKQVNADRVEPILSKLEGLSLNQLKSEKLDDKTHEIELFLKQYSMQFNEISRKIELEGEPLTDRSINSIYINAMHSIDHNVSKLKLVDMMDSDLTPMYNPFLDFFAKHSSARPKGLIQEVIDCFDIVQPDLNMEDLTEDERSADYLDVFLTRWLLGIISAMHGTYSLLVLVLVGGQGTGKSKFFRNLLPDELRSYYAESKLEKQNEIATLMSTKILILDDEYGGKNKRDSKAFKEISSRETFSVRKPYGRVFEDLKRYAVLCGTSNETEILNDTTGNRRTIPVEVKSIDIKRFQSIDKTALFMELYHLWKEIGDDWMLTSKEIAYLNKSTSRNEFRTLEEELLLKDFEPCSENDPNVSWLTASEIYVRLKNRYNVNKMSNVLIGKILKKHNFKGKGKRLNGSAPLWRYHLIDNYKDETNIPNDEGLDF